MGTKYGVLLKKKKKKKKKLTQIRQVVIGEQVKLFDMHEGPLNHKHHYIYLYTKIAKVCMYVCPLMHFASLRPIEPKMLG